MTSDTRSGPIARTVGRFLLIDLLVDKEARPVLIYVAMTLAFGTVLFHSVEHWDWLDSLYFVVVTTSTIGYGDFVPVSDLGKLITIIYSINGVAIIVMLFDQIRRVRGARLQSGPRFTSTDVPDGDRPDD